MPTYEYACGDCGQQWEEVQRITEAATTTCPHCGKASARRLISGGTNFILKGGGWYSDLYASSKGEAKKSDAKGGETSDKGADKASAPTEQSQAASAPAKESKPSTPTPATPASSAA